MSDVQENYGINIRKCKHFATLFLADTPLSIYARIGFEGNNDGEKVKVDRLNHAFTVTVREIAYKYVCFTTTDTIVINDEGKVHFYVLSEQLLEPLSLTQNGKEVSFKVKNNYLYAPSGEYEFSYVYMPKIDTDMEWLPYAPRLTEHIIALGTCANYCLMSGLYSEANAFDSAYKEALAGINKTFIKRSVKKRRWL